MTDITPGESRTAARFLNSQALSLTRDSAALAEST